MCLSLQPEWNKTEKNRANQGQLEQVTAIVLKVFVVQEWTETQLHWRKAPELYKEKETDLDFEYGLYNAKLFCSDRWNATFDCVSEWDSNCSKRDIAGNMAKRMTEGNRGEQLQLCWINRLQREVENSQQIRKLQSCEDSKQTSRGKRVFLKLKQCYTIDTLILFCSFINVVHLYMTMMNQESKCVFRI